MTMPVQNDPAVHEDNRSAMQTGNETVDRNMGYKIIESSHPPRTVRYDLYIADTIVNFAGKPKKAIAVNGQIPMPTLTFTEGDTAEIYVHNLLKEETSLHWHGLFLPNQYDGVPNVTQMPIPPGATHLYKFPIIQNGTHWYHSHSKLQEQIGMYGSFILNKRKEPDFPTIPVVLSEWTNMHPETVNRSLHNATDWFAIRKGAAQSYSEAIKTGHLKAKLVNEWKRMTPMDVSDVAYDKFFINGKTSVEYPSVFSIGDNVNAKKLKAGDKVRLRIANGGASSYFWLKYAGGKIIVVANDGNDVEPVEVDRLIIGVSETYDVIVTIPENKSYEFLVTPEDRTKTASLWLGSGEKVAARKMTRLKYFPGMKMMNDMMAMNGDLIPMEGMEMKNQIMDMNMVMYPEITGIEKTKKELKKESRGEASSTKKDNSDAMQMPGNSMADMNMEEEMPVTLNYEMLRATEKTTLRPGPVRELRFVLTGNMTRYVWSIDNKVVSEADKILIKKGENVRIIIYNNSMMRHPMHLHGHDFRLLNGQGDYAPMKNVVDIMPMERDTLEFAATESGDWFFHCHILYHMMSGMGRVFSYENSAANPEIPNPRLARRKLFADDRMAHPMARIGLESTGTDGELMFSNTRYRLSAEWRVGLNETAGYETESHFGRYFGKMQWLIPYIGWDIRKREIDPLSKSMFGQKLTLPGKNLFGQTNTKNFRQAVHLGVMYVLPMLIVADGSIDSDGKYRLQLSREDMGITPRLRLSWLVNTDKEYIVALKYIVKRNFAFSTHYDNDMGWGAGVTITY